MNKRESGNFAIILAFLIGGAALLCSVYFYFSDGGGASLAPKDPHSIVDEYAKRVMNSMGDVGTVNASVQRNPNPFSCLYTVTGDCAGKGGTFQLYETANADAVALSQLQHTAGISRDGAACAGYPSVDCPMRAETTWQPACSPGSCAGTKSFRMSASIRYDEGKGAQPIDWKSPEQLVTPVVALSKDIECARGGGFYQSGTCLAHPPERIPASDFQAAPAVAPTQPQPEQAQQPAQQGGPFVCPDSVLVQGALYAPEISTPGRAVVHVPSQTNCQDAYDMYIFTCNAASPQNFENEGAWVQVEAQMAPPCDESGHPMQALLAPQQ